MTNPFIYVVAACLIFIGLLSIPEHIRDRILDKIQEMLGLPWEPRTYKILIGSLLGTLMVGAVFAYRHAHRPPIVYTFDLPNHRPIAEITRPDAPRIGIVDEYVRPENAEVLGIEPGQGIYVGSVTPNSPATKAGIRQGDFLIAINGKRISNQEFVVEECAKLSPGDKVNLWVARGTVGAEYKLDRESLKFLNVKVQLGQPGTEIPH